VNLPVEFYRPLVASVAPFRSSWLPAVPSFFAPTTATLDLIRLPDRDGEWEL